MPKTNLVIGLDFDNTLVSYDDVMYQTAVELGLITDNTAVRNKEHVRDYIRQLPDGEIKWQKLQAEVYGKRMDKAQLIDGVSNFLLACKGNNVKTFIVSHKTKHAAQDTEGINLQAVARQWMKDNKFFDADGFALLNEHVFFEDTRSAKVARIQALGCTHFVDDLPEVFIEQGFPQSTMKILFTPGSHGTDAINGINMFRSWDNIHHYLFVKQ